MSWPSSWNHFLSFWVTFKAVLVYNRVWQDVCIFHRWDRQIFDRKPLDHEKKFSYPCFHHSHKKIFICYLFEIRSSNDSKKLLEVWDNLSDDLMSGYLYWFLASIWSGSLIYLDGFMYRIVGTESLNEHPFSYQFILLWNYLFISVKREWSLLYNSGESNRIDRGKFSFR